MASVHKKKSRAKKSKGRVSYEIRVTAFGQKRSYFPGVDTNKKNATHIGRLIEQLIQAAENNRRAPEESLQWAEKLPDKKHNQLASWGIVKRRRIQSEIGSSFTISKWFERYITIGKGTRDAETERQLNVVKDTLVRHFGSERTIDTIAKTDAEDFRLWLQTKGRIVGNEQEPEGLAKNTVRRRLGRCREIFNLAKRRGLIDTNPFEDEAVSVGSNPERQFFVPADWIERCIATLKPFESSQMDERQREEWRIMLAFARYGGMRSHETRIQRWEDIDIANRRMIVRSNKTPPERVCPIFPELLPHLMRAREMADSGQEWVVTRYDAKSNIATTFTKIIKRAGLEVWPKLMQNLRATRETELIAVYPIKDVASWLGNSAPIAMKHYAMTMKSSFERAISEGAGGVPIQAPQIAPHQIAVNSNQQQLAETSEGLEAAENTGKRLPVIATDYHSDAQGGTRTRTAAFGRGILSPLCLPIPPPGTYRIVPKMFI